MERDFFQERSHHDGTSLPGKSEKRIESKISCLSRVLPQIRQGEKILNL